MPASAKTQRVKKSMNIDRRLAGTIATWAEGAGVNFSEAVAMLCSQGLATWPGSPFAAPVGSSMEVVSEVRRAKLETVDELRYVIDEAVYDITSAIEKGASS